MNADDFGLDHDVNEAVEVAHRRGILTSASLLVGAPAASDAIERARRLPGLRVGLHLAVVDAEPILPAEAVSAIVGPDGRFKNNILELGFRYRFGRRSRYQVASEIRSQFEAFEASGLELDHVNAHKHMHLHPVIAAQMIEIGADFGLRSVRLPMEPTRILRRAEPSAIRDRIAPALLRFWISILRRRLQRSGLAHNDWLFGRSWSGRVNARRFIALLENLPPGLNEIYLHPRTSGPSRWASHGSADDLATLIDPEVREVIDRRGIRLTSYGAELGS